MEPDTSTQGREAQASDPAAGTHPSVGLRAHRSQPLCCCEQAGRTVLVVWPRVGSCGPSCKFAFPDSLPWTFQSCGPQASLGGSWSSGCAQWFLKWPALKSTRFGAPRVPGPARLLSGRVAAPSHCSCWAFCRCSHPPVPHPAQPQQVAGPVG